MMLVHIEYLYVNVISCRKKATQEGVANIKVVWRDELDVLQLHVFSSDDLNMQIASFKESKNTSSKFEHLQERL